MTETLPPQPWMTDPATVAVLDALEASGGAGCVRFVGGCVRNTLMGIAASDIDIATPLTPERVVEALEAKGLRAVPTGVEHGTVTAVSRHTPFEITTLRRDVETDGRRAVVAFTTDWAEDAQRRDFRFNALYADRHGRVFDPVGGGVEDAHAGRVIFVGDADTRIREDYLRILRFFRFHAWYGRGEIDAVGLEACGRLREGIARLSAERISKELLKLLEAPDPRPALRLMHRAGVLEIALPLAANLPRFEAMVDLDSDPVLRLAALVPDDPEAVRAAAQTLRLSNGERDRLVAAATREPVVAPDMDERAARAALYRIGERAFRDRLLLARAQGEGTVGRAQALLALADRWIPPRFPIGGGDLTAAGMSAGPAMGRLLKELEAWWVAQDFPAEGLAEELRHRLGDVA